MPSEQPASLEGSVGITVSSDSVLNPSAETGVKAKNAKEADAVDLDQFVDEEDYVITTHIPKSDLLPGHRSKEDFTFTDVKTTNTAHIVHRVFDKEQKEYFLKINSPGALISLLEKTAADFYRVLAPSYVSPTFAVYDNGTCIGVASEAIPNFKPYAEDKLTDSDLDLSFMEAKDLSIETLDKLEEELCQIELEEHNLKRQLNIENEKSNEIQKLIAEFAEEDGFFIVPDNAEIKNDATKKVVKQNQQKNEFNQKLDNLAVKYGLLQTIDGQVQDHPIPDDELLKKVNHANADKKLELEDKRIDLVEKKNQFRKKLDTQYNKLTLEELNKYRIIKGLAICFAISYIFTEDDLHAYNFSKSGKRLDFDMSLYDEVMYKAKNEDDLLLQLVEWIDLVNFIKLRAPTKQTSIVTSYDIDNLPDTKDRKVTFWPTEESVIIGSKVKWFRYMVMGTVATVKSGLNLRVNNYTPEDNVRFKKLKNMPVYRHHSFFMIAKYILTNADIYYQIASNDIPEGSQYTLNGVKKDVITHLTDTQKFSINDFLNKFLDVPDFADFFTKHHEAIAADLLKTLTQQNLNYTYNNEAKENNEEKENAELDNNPNTPAAQIKKRCEHILSLIAQKKRDMLTRVPSHSAKAPVNLAAILGGAKETKEPTPTPSELYSKIDTLIRTTMDRYINPGSVSVWMGVTTIWGRWRNHSDLAKKILTQCENLQTAIKQNQNDPEVYIATIKKLISVITEELGPFELAHQKKMEEAIKAGTGIKEDIGEMHKELLRLKEQIKGMIPQEMLTQNAAASATLQQEPG